MKCRVHEAGGREMGNIQMDIVAIQWGLSEPVLGAAGLDRDLVG